MNPETNTPTQPKTQAPSFSEALRFWLKLGFISFGGPTGQIAIMHSELVEKRKWISEARFLHALNYCMLLPGPEAQQLATYIGWLLHKTRGGIVAGTLFVVPSMFVLWTLSFIYMRFGNVPAIASVFYGLKPAVLAIVASAAIRIGRRALRNEVMWSIAGLAFVAIFFGKVPFPVIICTAGLVGLIGGRVWKEKFVSISSNDDRNEVLGGESNADQVRPTIVRAVRVCATCLVLWFLPLVILGALIGWRHAVVQEGIFFSKAAMITFGGAYAALPYVSQQAVAHFQWLTADQMFDGLGLAETTPGPLIMVLQFVGFVGAWNHPGELSPLIAATLGAFVSTWATFVPCFLWIFLGAPHIEQLRGNVKLTAALSTITAAVVGVILNLAVWFGSHVLFPGPGRIDWVAVSVTLVTFFGLLKWKWGVIPVVLGAAIFGWAFQAMVRLW